MYQKNQFKKPLLVHDDISETQSTTTASEIELEGCMRNYIVQDDPL